MSPGTKDFDVVIVGAGVAGAMVAYRLAKAGARVLMLEAGIRNPTRSQIAGAYAVAAIKSPHSPYIQIEADAKAPSPDSPADYEQTFTDPDKQYKSGYERRTGAPHGIGWDTRPACCDPISK
jgi:glucose dehydrogenase